MLTCKIRRLGTQTTDLYIQFVREELKTHSLVEGDSIELNLAEGCCVCGTVRTKGSTTWLGPGGRNSNRGITDLLRAAGLSHGSEARAPFTLLVGAGSRSAARDSVPDRRARAPKDAAPSVATLRAEVGPARVGPVPRTTMPQVGRSLDVSTLESGVRTYWEEIGKRSPEVQRREHEFPDLASRFASRNSPHFDRADLHAIFAWKHTDARWRLRAEKGLQSLSDEAIRQGTARIQHLTEPLEALEAFHKWARGVGPATISAMLAAAKPDLWPVIDVFVLEALFAYTQEPWFNRVPRKADGRPDASGAVWSDYVLTCRSIAAQASRASAETWTPRKVDMALWGLGKQLGAAGR